MTTFYFKFSCYSLKKDTAESVVVLFSPQKLVRLFPLKEVKPSPDRLMIKFLTFDTCFHHYNIFVNTRRMATAATFSRQNDVGSRAHTT